MYNMNVKNQQVKLIEIGGSDSVRGVWPHYYNDVMKFFEFCFWIFNPKKV